MVPKIRQENFLQKNGRFWMTSEQLGQSLGLCEPRIAVNKILNRNKDELKPFITITKLVTVTGEKDAVLLDEQGCYIVAMLARTEQAKQFRRALAQFLADLRKKQAGLADVQEAYRLSCIKLAKAQLAEMLQRLEIRPSAAKRLDELNGLLTNTELGRIFGISPRSAGRIGQLFKQSKGENIQPTCLTEVKHD